MLLRPKDKCTVKNADSCIAYKESCADYHDYHDSVMDGAKTICGTGTLSSPEGVKACKEYSSKAMVSFDGDALFGDNWCQHYGLCHALSSLPSAWGFVDSSEAAGAIESACRTDFATCKNVFQPVKCCFLGEPCSGNLDCGHYGTCDILFSAEQQIVYKEDPSRP